MKKWLITLVTEKGIGLDYVFEVEGKEWGTNFIPMEVLIEYIDKAPKEEKRKIKDTLVKIDFLNGDIMDFLTCLAKALAQ